MRWPIVGLVGAAGAVGGGLVNRWQMRWGATDGEVHGALPGDALVAEPATQVTRAISIDAPPESVWPWIAQLGADRGGFYSYACLENLFGLGIHNADVIVPEWQHRSVGDLVAADAAATGGWYVMQVVPGEALVLLVGDVRTGRPLQRDTGMKWEFLWTFVVRAAPGGGSRLIVRERVAFGSRVTALVMAPIGFVSFVMTRAMLTGVKSRAEARSARPEGIPAEVAPAEAAMA